MKKVWKSLVAVGFMASLSIASCFVVFGKDGSAQWKEINNSWYYFNSDGSMLTGWQNIGGGWYFLENSGAMHIGWLQLDKTWYYMDEHGIMVTGDREIGNKDYSFHADGKLYAGEVNLEKFKGEFSTEWYAAMGHGTSVEITEIKDGKVWGTYYYNYHNTGPYDVEGSAEFNGLEMKNGGIECDYTYSYLHVFLGEEITTDSGEGAGRVRLTFLNNDDGIFDYKTDQSRECSIQVNILGGWGGIPDDRLYPIQKQ